jgi:hypothetical protein
MTGGIGGSGAIGNRCQSQPRNKITLGPIWPFGTISELRAAEIPV